MGWGTGWGSAPWGGGLATSILCTDPNVGTVTALDTSGTRWRVTFDRLVKNNVAVAHAAAYALDNGSGHQPVVLKAEPQPGANSQYVDLTTDETIDGDTYTLTIHQLEESVTGGCNDPTIFSVAATNETTVRVTFGTAMIVNASLLQAAAYVVANAAHRPVVKEILPATSGTTTVVDLVTSEMRQGLTYSLTIHRLEAA